MAYSVLQHLAYNEWANTKIGEILETMDGGIFFKESKSSFPSIAKTVLHVWDAQVIWLKRMQGESLTAFPSTGFHADKKESIQGLIQSSGDLLGFIKSKDESFLETTYTYKNLKGESCKGSIEDTVFHVVNHGTYHRGQIITMIREAGETNTVSTDLIHYLRTYKR